MRRRQPRVLQQPQAMTAISSIFFRPQPALRSIPIRRSFCCAMISTGSCQCCRPREKQNPFISAHWAAIEPTRYVCKSSTSWDGPGRRQRKSGHPSGYSPKPGMRIHWPSPCWQKSPLYVSIRRRIHACPRRPDPCGRAWKALSHLRGKYHKLREKFAVAVLENHLNRLKERPTHSGCSSPCVTFSATRALAGLKRTGLLACCNKGQYARAKEQHTTHGKRTLPAKAVKHDASCR